MPEYGIGIPRLVSSKGEEACRVVTFAIVVSGSGIPVKTIEAEICRIAKEEASKYFRGVPGFDGYVKDGRLVITIKPFFPKVDGLGVPYSSGSDRHYHVRISISRSR